MQRLEDKPIAIIKTPLLPLETKEGTLEVTFSKSHGAGKTAEKRTTKMV